MTDSVRVGIEVGGTFTDLVAIDENTGQTLLVKSSSTPHDPSEGVIESIKELLTTHPSEVELIVHASTVGANLFLGQLGLSIPKGALVTSSMCPTFPDDLESMLISWALFSLNTRNTWGTILQVTKAPASQPRKSDPDKSKPPM